MRNMKHMIALLAAMILMALLSTAAVSAESYELNGSAEFTGEEITSSFKTGEIADAVTDLQPGDDVSFMVEYKNTYPGVTEWYMTNEIVQTLEKANSARKVVKGTGTAENGAYTYELIHVDKNQKETVIFSNSKVGGEETPNNMQGLEQATNATSEWFYLQDLDEGEHGKIKLHIAFEGETEVNDYMDTDGALELAFAVEIPDEEKVNKPVKKEKKTPSKKAVKSRVKTGDDNHLMLYVGMLAAGLALLIVVLKQKGGDTDEEK